MKDEQLVFTKQTAERLLNAFNFAFSPEDFDEIINYILDKYVTENIRSVN